jgi:hypothetical protein
LPQASNHSLIGLEKEVPLQLRYFRFHQIATPSITSGFTLLSKLGPIELKLAFKPDALQPYSNNRNGIGWCCNIRLAVPEFPQM